jgi:hypothetical protein
MGRAFLIGGKFMSCAHCKGSGFCQYSSVYYNSTDKQNSYCFMRCSKCGDGPSKKYTWLLDPEPGAFDTVGLKFPVCSACGGKGY